MGHSLHEDRLMVTGFNYAIGTRASQTILQSVDPKMEVDGSWGSYTQGVFDKASSTVKDTIRRVLKTVSGSSPEDMAAFRKVEKLSTIKGDRSVYKTVVQPAVVKAAEAAGFTNSKLLLAQLDLESGNGKSMAAANNYSGIKWFDMKAGPMASRIARYGATPGPKVQTWERVNGQAVKVMASFMAFPSADAFAGYYVDYLREKYPKTVAASTPRQFVDAMGVGRIGGYATDEGSTYLANITSMSARYA